MFGQAGLRALRIMGLGLLVTVTQLALGDPAQSEQQRCPVSSKAEARRLGDALFEQGAYQRAGQCYEAASEYALANRAFLKAAGPESAVTARQLADQRDQAKTMLRNVQQAFRVGH